MSTSEIPNLKSLLSSRRGGGFQSRRGRGHNNPGASTENIEAVKDSVVQSTDHDAATSRLSCVELGYLDDPFAAAFVTPGEPMSRRLPLLNRGTYVRTTAIDHLIEKFLSTSPSSPKQIISLGAGTDTRFFRILSRHGASINLVYHEFDFPAITSSKVGAIERSPTLSSLLTTTTNPTNAIRLEISDDKTRLTSERYNIHPIDLRSLVDTNTPTTFPNLSKTTPTILLSECCLTYLPSATATSILHTLVTTILPPPTPCSLILYEPINPHDAFGRTMISNLASRNIYLPTLTTYPTISSQRRRLKDAGFEGGQRAADTGFIWKEWVGEREKERVGALEMLDEFEELELLLGHYCVVWGWRDGGPDGAFTRAWEGIEEQVGDGA
ncbi:leucine carboxyl methyltransferase [Lepidopterella palustris CBS 459.81]|uniref:Leucine carboxyl methyltransferase 1 n=1 Tax=Lepidopterella palustris CBS 459.81 TaxID=1314670 RepID=A0A8E2JEX6_9PEZI|nr:leucine carboxyl methyltransferase [Lepidopterella palustris CBS 459.81]